MDLINKYVQQATTVNHLFLLATVYFTVVALGVSSSCYKLLCVTNKIIT
jgi:hypothetical protein